jgi:hypothetical protein
MTVRLLPRDSLLIGGGVIADGELLVAASRDELLAVLGAINEMPNEVKARDFETRLGATYEQTMSLWQRLYAAWEMGRRSARQQEGRPWSLKGIDLRREASALGTGEDELADGEVALVLTRGDLALAAAAVRVALETIEEVEFQTRLGVYTWEAQAVLDALRLILAETA